MRYVAVIKVSSQNFKGHRGVSKEGEAYFNNMPVFVLGRPILLVGIWTRNMMRYANSLEKSVQLLVLATRISLDSKYLFIELTFYHVLKVMKFLKNLRFVT